MPVCSRQERGTRVAQLFVNCRFLTRMGAPRPLRGPGHANQAPFTVNPAPGLLTGVLAYACHAARRCMRDAFAICGTESGLALADS